MAVRDSCPLGHGHGTCSVHMRGRVVNPSVHCSHLANTFGPWQPQLKDNPAEHGCTRTGECRPGDILIHEVVDEYFHGALKRNGVMPVEVPKVRQAHTCVSRNQSAAKTHAPPLHSDNAKLTQHLLYLCRAKRRVTTELGRTITGTKSDSHKLRVQCATVPTHAHTRHGAHVHACQSCGGHFCIWLDIGMVQYTRIQRRTCEVHNTTDDSALSLQLR